MVGEDAERVPGQAILPRSGILYRQLQVTAEHKPNQILRFPEQLNVGFHIVITDRNAIHDNYVLNQMQTFNTTFKGLNNMIYRVGTKEKFETPTWKNTPESVPFLRGLTENNQLKFICQHHFKKNDVKSTEKARNPNK